MNYFEHFVVLSVVFVWTVLTQETELYNNESGKFKRGGKREGAFHENFTASRVESVSLVGFRRAPSRYKHGVSENTQPKVSAVYNKPSDQDRYTNKSLISLETTDKETVFQGRNTMKKRQVHEHLGFDDTVNADLLEREKAFNISNAKNSPYSLLLLRYDENDELIRAPCTGSLLTRQWVLTAAFCLKHSTKNVTTIVVYAGGNSRREFLSSEFAEGSEILNSTLFLVHPNYTRDEYDVTTADIGILKVNGKFSLTSKVNVLKLSPKLWSFKNYTSCTVTGFGKVYKFDTSRFDYVRKRYDVRVRSPCRCSKAMQKMLRTPARQERRVCARMREYKGVCEGDLGAALVCGGQIAAVTSPFVTLRNAQTCELQEADDLECGMNNTVNVFEVVCPYLEWIKEHVHMLYDEKIKRGCQSKRSSASVKHPILLGYFVTVYCLGSHLAIMCY